VRKETDVSKELAELRLHENEMLKNQVGQLQLPEECVYLAASSQMMANCEELASAKEQKVELEKKLQENGCSSNSDQDLVGISKNKYSIYK